MYVYFIQSGNGKKPPVKIGVAQNIDKRLRSLQTANPEKLTLIASIECANRLEAFNIESYLHEKLVNRRIRGEWFATCMRRIDKHMSKWYKDKSIDSETPYSDKVDQELDMECLINAPDL